MALTTRVWSAGKLLLLGGALLLHLRALCRRRDAFGAEDARSQRAGSLAGKTVNEARRSSRRLGLNLKVEEGRRIDPKVPAGQVLAQEPPARRPDAARAQRQGLGQRRTARRRSCRRSSARSERTAQLRLQQDGLD